MKRWTNRHSATAASAVFLLATVLLTNGWATAQQPPAENDPPPAKKERAKPRGRLPSYFARVVTEKQREEIYGIQTAYAEQLDKLREQIVQLESKRDKEVDQVLSAEQLAQVKELRDQAKAKRAERTRKKATASSSP